MQIIQSRQRVEVHSYYLLFAWADDPEAGFMFECDEQGNLLLDEIPESARENLRKCQADEYNVINKGVQKFTNVYYDAAIGRCYCGRDVILEDVMTNECESCGRLYNGFGQDLAPRSQWGLY